MHYDLQSNLPNSQCSYPSICPYIIFTQPSFNLSGYPSLPLNTSLSRRSCLLFHPFNSVTSRV